MTNAKEYAKEHTYRIPMLDASIIYKFNGLNSGISLLIYFLICDKISTDGR